MQHLIESAHSHGQKLQCHDLYCRVSLFNVEFWLGLVLNTYKSIVCIFIDKFSNKIVNAHFENGHDKRTLLYAK